MQPESISTPATRVLDRSATRSRHAIRIALVVSLALSQAGCANFWEANRERERMFALNNARTQTKRGQCESALASLDRAQARIDLGQYARESTLARVRCYEKLGLNEFASAQRRLITDFYTDEPMAIPDPDGTSIFRVKTLSDKGYDRPPHWLQFPAPRYSPYAQRSKIVGRVVVAFELASSNTPRKIRVLEMPHPLLATWAIEAVASGQPKKKEGTTVLMPGGRYVTTFVFEWRWAKEAQEEEFDS
jgi:hypothetical protein